MATPYVLPQSPNTGLTSLANVLLSGATDYANDARTDRTDARRRAERLADIESERAYAEKSYGRTRADRLSDVSGEREYQTGREERKRDEQLEDVRDARYWEERIRNKGGEEAQLALNQLTENEAAVMARMTAREKRLSAPEPMPTREQVMPRALALARQSTGKATPPTAEIEAAIPMAMEEARTVLNQTWQRDRLDAQESQRIDASLLNRISAEKNVITNIFRRVAAPQSAPEPTSLLQGAQTPKLDAAAVRASFANQLIGKNTGTVSAPPQQPSRLFNPGNDPIVAREQDARDTAMKTASMMPLNDIRSQLADIQGEITRVQTSAPPTQIQMKPGFGGMSITTPQSPGLQAEQLSNLFTKQAELKKRLSALQEPAIAPAAAPVGAAWWMNPQQ